MTAYSGGILKTDPNELAAELAGVFLLSNSAPEYCRNIVLNRTIGTGAIGTQLFIVNQDGNLGELASFGVRFTAKEKIISLSDDHPVARAITQDQEIHEVVKNPITGEPAFIFIYPFRRPSHPVGACLMLKRTNYNMKLNPGIQQTLSLMGALWLESIGITPALTTVLPSQVEELSPRQTHVLALIAQGRTNLQIANELFLSESSIKQECVKIYRILGVATREAARNKAASLGMTRSAKAPENYPPQPKA